MSISRRKFLGWIGVTGLTVAGGRKAKAATIRQFEGYPNSLAVLHDITLCLGCRKCERACNEVNELPEPTVDFTNLSVLQEKRRTTNATYTVVNQYETETSNTNEITQRYYKQQCNHCLEPACASACFVGAFKKTEEGAVKYDPSVCVGCRYCMIACPFEIPTYEYDNAFSPRIRKCTMCHKRIIKGQIPGCVESCPAGALTFGKRSELIKIAKSRINSSNGKYIDHVYGENEMGGTSWLYISDIAFKEMAFRTDLGNTAAGNFTAPALSAVPIIVALWPILLTGIYAMAKNKETLANRNRIIAVEKAVNKVKQEAKIKLDQVMSKAEKDKVTAVELGVKKALADADKAITKSSDYVVDKGGNTE